MANKRSTYSWALDDMLKEGLNVEYIKQRIKEIHHMNSVLKITTVEIRVKEEPKKEPKIKAKPAPKINLSRVTVKHVYNQRIIINPDGTVSIENSGWDID